MMQSILKEYQPVALPVLLHDSGELIPKEIDPE